MNMTIHLTESDLMKAKEFVASDAGLRLAENEDAKSDDILTGKLGEIAFAKFLQEHGKILLNDDDLLLTWDDVYTLDRLNLKTSDGKTVDVKASTNRGSTLIQTPNGDEIAIRRQSILVPYHNVPRDYYVGVGISRDKITGTVEGFIHRTGLHPSGPEIQRPCHQREFDSLEYIGDLLEIMPEAAKLINIEWGSPCSLEDALKLDKKKDKGLYQIYGPHIIYGSNVLLYIGKTETSFSQRLQDGDHRWVWEEQAISIRVGRILNEDYTYLEAVENLEIYWHSPAYNALGINSYSGKHPW